MLHNPCNFLCIGIHLSVKLSLHVAAILKKGGVHALSQYLKNRNSAYKFVRYCQIFLGQNHKYKSSKH